MRHPRVVYGPRCEYDPDSRTVYLTRDASDYLKSHEFAHARQHAEGTWLWRACRSWWSMVPLIGPGLRVALEIDALRRARYVMGRRWKRHRLQAWLGILGYWRIFLPFAIDSSPMNDLR